MGIFNTVKENLLNKVKPLQWVSRGDFSGADFVHTDYIRDGAWHDLDLSGIIDVGAKSVLIRLTLKAISSAAVISFRKKGYVGSGNTSSSLVQIAAKEYRDDIWVEPDAIGIVEYSASDDAAVTWVDISTYVRSWLI